jgi:hypothetical protein
MEPLPQEGPRKNRGRRRVVGVAALERASMKETTQDRLDRRLIAWGLGLVPENEAREIERWWIDLQREGGQPAPKDTANHHVPARLLVHWPRVRSDLSGLERELVESHFSRCERCREDLSLLVELPRTAAVPQRLTPWIGGGAVGALLAASVTWLLLGPPSDEAPSVTPSDGPVPWVAPSFARGIEPSTADVAPGQAVVLIVSLPTEVSAAETAQLAIRDPNGRQIAHFELAAERFVMGSALLQLHPAEVGGQWLAGTYELSLRIGDQSDLGEFVLRPSSVATNPAQ